MQHLFLRTNCELFWKIRDQLQQCLKCEMLLLFSGQRYIKQHELRTGMCYMCEMSSLDEMCSLSSTSHWMLLVINTCMLPTTYIVRLKCLPACTIGSVWQPTVYQATLEKNAQMTHMCFLGGYSRAPACFSPALGVRVSSSSPGMCEREV